MEKQPLQAKQEAQTKSATAVPNTKYQIPNTTKSSALWREVTEEEKEEIRQDSKKLLEEFASKLQKIKAPKGHSASNTKGYTERCENELGTREEGTGWKTDEEFKSTTLANAPFVEDNFLVAEKGAWKK
jgi:hypothetical protein